MYLTKWHDGVLGFWGFCQSGWHGQIWQWRQRVVVRSGVCSGIVVGFWLIRVAQTDVVVSCGAVQQCVVVCSSGVSANQGGTDRFGSGTSVQQCVVVCGCVGVRGSGILANQVAWEDLVEAVVCSSVCAGVWQVVVVGFLPIRVADRFGSGASAQQCSQCAVVCAVGSLWDFG